MDEWERGVNELWVLGVRVLDIRECLELLCHCIWDGGKGNAGERGILAR